MTDVKKDMTSINFQAHKLLGISLGLACTIPIASPAVAGPENREPRSPKNLEARLARKAEKARITIQPVETGAKFNLNSGRAVFSAGSLGNFHNLTINVGGREKIVNINSRLTAGEMVAAQQMLNGGQQQIVLGRNGAADGGTITLNADMLSQLHNSVGGSIDSMTIARGVQVVDNTSGIALSGTLRNFGDIMTAAEVSGATNTISATIIHNGRGGAIGSYTGSDLFAADVQLNAGSLLINNGTISSAGNLTINAASIQNSGSTAAMSAAQNVNLNTQNLVNTGLIAGHAINLASNGALSVVGAGALQAATDINIASNNANITMSGGNLFSQEVNFSSGLDGRVSADLGQVTGRVNSIGCVMQLSATSDLTIGNVTAFGDPIFQAGGDLVIDGAIIPTGGAPLTLIAGGNITAMPGTVLDTSNLAGDGGDLNVIAGVRTKVKKKTGDIIAKKKNKTGGSIDLTGLATISTFGTGGVGGDIQIIAFQGKNVGTGRIDLDGSPTVNAGGTDGNGNVTIIGTAKDDPLVPGPVVAAGDVIANNLTIGTGTTAAPKGGVVFADITGELLTGPFSIKSPTTGGVDLNGTLTFTGNGNIQTAGILNVNNTIDILGEASETTITAGTLNVNGSGNIAGGDGVVVNSNVSGAMNVANGGNVNVGTHNLKANALTIDAGGILADAFANYTINGPVQIDGELGRDPLADEPARDITTFNILVGKNGTFNVGPGGLVSGDGAITSSTFTNEGTMRGSIAYTATSKKGAGFSNFGLVDGLTVTVNSAQIFNDVGAFLQATLQTNDEDIPTLNLNTSLIENLGQIGAVGIQKQTDGFLNIIAPKDLTIVGVDGGFFTGFNSTIALTANNINIGGNDGVVNSNPFSAIDANANDLGSFFVSASGEFRSNMPGLDVYADPEGDHGQVNILAKGLVYNGVGAAPLFQINATGTPGESESVEIVVVEITGKQGITIGSQPGNLSVNITGGYDPASSNSFVTPTNLNVDMANLILNNTGLNLEGTKSLLITGDVVGGENVSITTAAKKAFLIGNAVNSGQTGLAPGEGISATKTLTINVPGGLDIQSGFRLMSGENLFLNAPSLTVQNGGDILPADPLNTTLTVTLNTGAASKAKYSNFNPGGFLSAPRLTINTSGLLTLDSGGGNQVETVLSLGTDPNNTDGVGGGGTFTFNASELKFANPGIFFNVPSPDPGNPNGGGVILNLTTSKTVKVGFGNGSIRANVFADPLNDSPEGAGDLRISTVGNIVAKDILLGAVIFGDGGALSLSSSTSTVTVSDIAGKVWNLFALTTNSSTDLLASNAKNNGVKDDTSTVATRIGGGNVVFRNTGKVVTNGAFLRVPELNLQSSTEVDVSGNLFLQVVDVSNEGGVLNISAPILRVGNNGLLVIGEGGADSGASINVTTTATTSDGDIRIGPLGTSRALTIDVSDTVNNVGSNVNIQSGANLRVDGTGLIYGLQTDIGASLTLQSGQATESSSGGILNFQNANSATMLGLSFGTVTLNSGSSSSFSLAGAGNNGNGLVDGGLTAGTVIVQPRAGFGTINTTGYAMVTNNLQLNGAVINFANQTISVLDDGAIVGSGQLTGNGGNISIISSDLRFNNAGGVLLEAIGNGAAGGTISITDNATKNLTVGAAGFSFDVTNNGGPAGQVGVNQTGAHLIVDATAFEFGAANGGQLNLQAAGNMLISNIASLNGASLDKATFVTNGATTGPADPFQFGSAVRNGFTDANPTFAAQRVEIVTAGKNAGIDVTGGTIDTSFLTLKTTGDILIDSGGTLAVSPFAANGNGGNMTIVANAITQVGGNAGYTLSAVAAAGGAGGVIDVTLTTSDTLVIGAGGMSVDISNDPGNTGGIFKVKNGGDITVDFAFVDVGSNFGGQGPNIDINANGELAANNVTLIANIGLGGGQLVNASVTGIIHDGCFTQLVITNALLPGGQLVLEYIQTAGDTVQSIAQAFNDLVNNNTELQNLGITAEVDGNVITLRSTTAGTTYSIVYDPDPDCRDEDGNPLLDIALQTFTTGLTLASKSSQPFVLGGADPGANGIQDNNLVLDIGAITIQNTGILTAATIKGSTAPGLTDTIIVNDPNLPNGTVSVSYTFVEGDTRESIAAALANAINTTPALQIIGVTASANGTVVNLSATGSETTFAAVAGKKNGIELATVAQGGDIANGNLVSLTGVSTTGPAILNASGNIGSATERIQLAAGAGSIVTSSGLDTFIQSDAGTSTLNMNAGGRADAFFTAGDIDSANGTAGSWVLNYDNPNNANTNSVTLSSITTTNGELFVRSDSQFLVVDGNLRSNFGNITLLNFQPGGTIQIVDDSTILGSGAVTALNQGNVYIGFNTVPFGNFIPGITPPGVTIIETVGGQVTFSQNPAPAGTITADPSATFQALGRDLAFFQGLPDINIVVGMNVVITADPPASGGLSGMLANVFSQSDARIEQASRNSSASAATAALTNSTQSAAASVSSVSMPDVSIPNVGSTLVESVRDTSSSMPAAGTTVPATNNQVNDVLSALGSINVVGLNNAQSAIQDTTLNTVTNSNNVGQLSATALDFQAAMTEEPATTTTLVGEVSNESHRTHQRGPLLIAPQQDQTIETPHGTVHIAGKSLALIIASDAGLSVYNLHDVRKHAVKVHKDGHSFAVAPGTSAVITPASASTFEDVNPAQFVRYRNLQNKALGKHKVYHAEFEVLTLLGGLPGFKDMLNSDDPEVRKTMTNVLKTAAILMQLSAGGEQFKEYAKPQVTAYTK